MRKPVSEAEKARRAAAAEERLKGALSQLDEGVSALISSDRWADYLRFASSFHAYSFNNVMLIMLQRPDATQVASYGSWQKHGRQVRKGEKGIRILAPILVRPKADDRRETRPEAGEEETPARKQMVGVKTVSVFDVEQTDGDPLPMVEPQLLEGEAVPHLWNQLQAFVEARGFTVIREDCDGANGRTNFTKRTVSVRPDVSELQAVKTLAHEVGHTLLHEPSSEDVPDCRGVIEVEAESVAFMTLHTQGLDASDYTFPYVARWAEQASDKDTTIEEVVRRTGNRVITATRSVLDAIEPMETTVDMEQLADRAAALNVDRSSTSAPTVAAGDARLPILSAERHDELNRMALQFWTDYGRRERALETLEARGIDAIPDEFTVGYAPVGGGLVMHLEGLGVQRDEILAAHLGRQIDSDRGPAVVDTFRDRLIVPLREDGKCVGFVGRRMSDDPKWPKYINSAASEHFRKSRVLYGLEEARAKLEAGAVPVLVEGPMDALAVAQYGGQVAPVAPCGTAFTAEHERTLREVCPKRRIILALDDDAAGRKSMLRTGELLTQAGWTVRVTTSSRGLDPASIVEKHGSKVMEWLNPRRCHPWLYRATGAYVEQFGQLDTVERKVEACRRTLQWLEGLPESPERAQAFERVRGLAGLPEASREDFFERAASDPMPEVRAAHRSVGVDAQLGR